MKLASSLAVLANNTTAKDLNVGIFSDLHMDLNYNPTSKEWNCMDPVGDTRSEAELNSLKTQQKALLGRLGCDPPKELVNYMLTLFD